MRIGSLFSGAGGLDMAVEQVFGGQVVWHCEPEKIRDKDTSPWRSNPVLKVLAARWPDVPNLGDITQIDFGSVAEHGVGWDFEPIDILCGGFPCQDVSPAGKRAGMGEGTRSGLWAYYADAIAALQPKLVIIENVRGLLNAKAHRAMESDPSALGNGDAEPVLRALGAVLGDLSDIGYDAQWETVAASDVGSCHRRERVFIVAHPAGDGRARLNGGASSTTARSGRQRIASGSAGSRAATDTASHRRHEGRPESAGLVGRPDAAIGRAAPLDLLPMPRSSDCFGPGLHGDGGMDLRTTVTLLPTPVTEPDTGNGHARNLGKEVKSPEWGKYEPAIRRWESLTRPAPSPTEPNTKGHRRLAAPFAEWMMGWPSGWVTDVPGISRNDMLRIIGNGVVPQQGAAALRWLLSVSEAVA